MYCKGEKEMAEIKNITQDEYDFETSQGLVLVDFWAPWCSNCKMLAPSFDALAEMFDGKVRFLKIDADEFNDFAVDKDVESLPTLIFYKDGKEVDRSVGFKLKVALERWIESLL